MSEFYYEETPEVKESVKQFCQKVHRYYRIENKKERRKEEKTKKSSKGIKPMRIPISSVNESDKKNFIRIDNCQFNDDEYNIQLQEIVKLPKEDKFGNKELSGGEMWIQSQKDKVKDDGMPLTYVFSDSVSHWSAIMNKIGLEKGMEKQLKFVPESNRKWKSKH